MPAHTPKQPSPLGSTHHHNLGHKLIKRYAEIFRHNAPRFTIISAQYRTISMVISDNKSLIIEHRKRKCIFICASQGRVKTYEDYLEFANKLENRSPRI